MVWSMMVVVKVIGTAHGYLPSMAIVVTRTSLS